MFSSSPSVCTCVCDTVSSRKKKTHLEDDVARHHVRLPPTSHAFAWGVLLQCEDTCAHHVQPVDVCDVPCSRAFVSEDAQDVAVAREEDAHTLGATLLVARPEAGKLAAICLPRRIPARDARPIQRIAYGVTVEVEAGWWKKESLAPALTHTHIHTHTHTYTHTLRPQARRGVCRCRARGVRGCRPGPQMPLRAARGTNPRHPHAGS